MLHIVDDRGVSNLSLTRRVPNSQIACGYVPVSFAPQRGQKRLSSSITAARQIGQRPAPLIRTDLEILGRNRNPAQTITASATMTTSTVTDSQPTAVVLCDDAGCHLAARHEVFAVPTQDRGHHAYFASGES